MFYYIFRSMSQSCLVHTDDIINNLVMDIPYDEMSGVQIGENFSAGGGAVVPAAAASHKVSAALTTNCPVCSGVITPGQNPCPHCNATLEWQS